jgi:ubiquinone/menaquinone biosynthesis C-methylase UbiE
MPAPAPWVRRLIAQILSQPRIYDALQILAGVRTVDAHVGRYTSNLGDNGTVLDVGGGTGRLRRLFSERWQYICVDNELPKLQGAGHLVSNDQAILADALALPIRDQCVDVILCVMVTHHLPLASLPGFFQEFRRVLRPDGTLIFLDWLAAPDRLLSRVLAAYDQGAFPHTREELEQVLSTHFLAQDSETFSVLHHYGLWRASPVPLEHP